MRRDDSHRPKDWFARAMADLGAAAILLKHGGDRAVAAMHVQQAVEKALKGYLISKGWKLKRTHDLIQLLDQAVRFEAGFEKSRSFCEEATAYFFEARYPLFISSRNYRKSEVRSAIRKAQAIFELAETAEEE